MRVLILHNRYRIAGGEEAVVAGESALLRNAGVVVELLEVTNEAIAGAAQTIKTAILTPYSPAGRRLAAERIRAFKPDVVHVHNFFPTLSPSVYDACRSAGVAVVQTLHNYRLVCANGLLFRAGSVCTECLGRTWTLPAIRHGCYRGSRMGSAAVAAMIGVHRVRGTWAERVDRFIVLTEFARGLFTERAGIPPEKIVVKPNAAPDAGEGEGAGGFALYVGRLSPEKGVETLLAAAASGLSMPLVVAGSGPLQAKVEAAQREGKLTYVGLKDPEAVQQLMRQARLLLIPSLWYEGLPMVVPEAFSAGLPIAASRIGSLETLIEEKADGEVGNGLLFEPGSPDALAEGVRRFAANCDHEPAMRRRARATYEALYRPEANLKMLLAIYEEARAQARRDSTGPANR
ncbi:MAG TPA: glycosyltransferase [Terracidiphilus sp.]|nr:glycosyltransferase [Terracidiphilus sp.]